MNAFFFSLGILGSGYYRHSGLVTLTRACTVQRWQKLTTPRLLQQRVPCQWPDASHLCSVGRQHYGDCTNDTHVPLKPWQTEDSQEKC